MSSKVLVADDSLTIQKVVSITLSGDEFTLIECLNENDLIAKVSSQEFDLILVDFNLSESRTGYQLCKEVSSISQNTPIMAMLGTFDNVQEDELGDAGVMDKIVKPFESEKFIKKCRELIAQSVQDVEDFGHDRDDDAVNFDEPEQDEDQNSDENWVVDAPGLEFETQQDESPSQESQHEPELEEASGPSHVLESELADWGVSVPGVIGKEANDFGIEQPPVIQQAAQEASAPAEDAVLEVEDSLDENLDDEDDDEPIEPPQADLEYPDLGAEPKSRLVPLDDLESSEEESEDSQDEDATDPDIQVEGLEDLQKEIEKELSPDEFWATDSDDEAQEVVEDEGSISGALENPVIQEEVQASNTPSQNVSAEQIDIDELAEKIKERLTPMLDEWAKKYCESAVDKVAWEVIPDLAENLIRKEIQEISESVKD